MRKIFTLLFSLVSVAIFAQWSSNPQENTNVIAPLKAVYEWKFGINPDNSITTIFSAPNEGKIEMYYNIHNAEGVSILPEGAKLLASESTMTWTAFGAIGFHDSKGNMLAFYQNYSNAEKLGKYDGYLNYNVYKISPTGDVIWTLDLNRGGYSEYLQYGLSVAELEDGSYMVAYCDVDMTQVGRIYYDRISADGKLLWDEPMSISDPVVPYSYPYLINAGDNQVLLLYVKGTNQDLMLRKLDFDGSAVWTNDVVVYRGGFPQVPVWTLLSIISDGEGGAFISWRDDRFFTNFEKSYVSHILSDGSYGYASGVDGEAVGYTEGLRSFEPTMLYNKKDKSLYTLRRETSSSQATQRLMIQKMADTGELLWGPEGVELRANDGSAVAYFDLQFAEDGNVVAFYMVQHDGVSVSAFAQKFNKETGELMWNEPLEFTPRERSRSSLKATPLINNEYWIVMWEDQRLLDEDQNDDPMNITRLYMQRINIDGTLGVQTSIDLVEKQEFDVQVVDNAIIAPEGSEIYTITGLRVDNDNLVSGVYIVRYGKSSIKVFVK